MTVYKLTIRLSDANYEDAALMAATVEELAEENGLTADVNISQYQSQ